MFDSCLSASVVEEEKGGFGGAAGVRYLSCPAVSQSWRWTLNVFPVVVPLGLDAVYT